MGRTVTYIVLHSPRQDGAYEYRNHDAGAPTAAAAIEEASRTLLENGGDIAGHWVAVPTRYWNPKPVTATQQLVIKVGD